MHLLYAIFNKIHTYIGLLTYLLNNNNDDFWLHKTTKQRVSYCRYIFYILSLFIYANSTAVAIFYK